MFLQESRRECVLEDASMLTKTTTTCQERQKIVESATKAVRNRHTKALHLFLYVSCLETELSLNRAFSALQTDGQDIVPAVKSEQPS